jgi:hypothetical protein
MKYLPYTIEQLREHIEKQWEPWMNWQNHSPFMKEIRTWQIDHIVPQVSLPYDDFSHPNFLLCWALTNLQPLESSKNLQKGCRSY